MAVSDHRPTTRAPRAVYVHVPFCRHRCGYCNFSVVANRDHLIDTFLQAIELEIAQVDGRPRVDTIYLGGGTPSRLPVDKLSFLLRLLDQRFELASHGEFTIEANPEDLPGDISNLIQDSRINRISLGVQSFDETKLASLERHPDRSQIEKALETTRNIADRFSIDLIFAAPKDSPEIWQRDLQLGIASGAGHISTYQLTFEKGTQFWNRLQRNQMTEIDQQTSADYYQTTISTLTAGGFQHYEVSSFARPWQRSQHNQVYWNGEPYLAFGPGASGYVAGTRYTNHRSISRYLKLMLETGSAISEFQKVSPAEQALDQIVFGLRLIEGVDLSHWSRRTGFNLSQLLPDSVLNDLQSMGLVEQKNGWLKMTRAGLFVGDLVCSTILKNARI